MYNFNQNQNSGCMQRLFNIIFVAFVVFMVYVSVKIMKEIFKKLRFREKLNAVVYWCKNDAHIFFGKIVSVFKK